MPRKAKKQGPRKNASPGKPYPEFPLTPHASGRFRKIYKGKSYWFGPIDDPSGALERYKHDWAFITEGKRPPARPSDGQEYQRLDDAVNIFIQFKDDQRKNGELSDSMFADYLSTAKLILEPEGMPDQDVESIGPDDFREIRAEMAKGRGLVSLGNHITRARSIFKFMYEDGLRAEPFRYGQGFSKPAAHLVRKHRAGQPDKTFTAEECRTLIEAASPQLRAMIYLGLNAGYGNQDVSNLNRSDLNFKTKILKVARSKTGNPRRAVLWPETIAAIREALGSKIQPATDEDRGAVFLTSNGLRMRRKIIVTDDAGQPKGRLTDAVQLQFRRLVDRTKLHVKGRGFYGLRHTFRTATDDLADRPALDIAMGHTDKTMRAHYVQGDSITTDRLKAVSDHMRAWLRGEGVDE